MSRKPSQPNAPEELEPADEPSAGALPTDPELEAALREAADAVPDAGPDRSIPLDDEVMLDDSLVETESPAVEVNRLRQHITESNDRMLRLQADFENFRKRAFKERQDALNYGHQNLVKDLLSVVDNLDRAIGHAQQSEDGDLQSLLQGVDLVQRELLGVLQKHNVTEVEALGKLFNPAFHEAMAQVEDGSVPPNGIVEVLEKGYQLRDRLVRPARVVVAKMSDEQGVPDEESDSGVGEAAD